MKRKEANYGSTFGTMAQIQTSTARSTRPTTKPGQSPIRVFPMGRPGVPTQSVAASKAIGSPKGMLRRGKNGVIANHDLFFRQSVYAAMIRHCLEEKPFEACGLLSGKDGMACTLWPMVNILKSRTAFEMDTRQIEAVFRKIEEKGEQLAGIYHSHPTAPPYPSQSDIVHANYPEAAYVIVSLSSTSPEVRCFHILDQQVLPIRYALNDTL